MSVTARITGKGEDRKLQVTLDLYPEPTLSKSEKTLVIASTRGNQQTTLEVEGKLVTIGLNAYIKK